MPSDDDIVWLTENEVLLRQVHPSQINGTVPKSAAFRPMKRHHYTLSTRREWVGAQQAYEQHCALNLESAGTWGISVDECAGIELDAFDDSALPDTPPGHVSIPFGIPKRDTEKDPELIAKSRTLRDYAIRRGNLYMPPPSPV
jgi:hypothetical protein